MNIGLVQRLGLFAYELMFNVYGLHFTQMQNSTIVGLKATDSPDSVCVESNYQQK